MGNCLPKKPIAAAHPPATVHLRGPPASPAVSLLRVALSYKSVAVQLLPTPEGPLALHCGADVVRGPVGGILRYLDENLPGPAVLWAEDGGSPASAAVALQHRSMERQLERMAGELEAAETRRLARSYGQLAELLLEHARMEETVLFPLLDSSSPPHHPPGLCRSANEQHARDLPIINGIKEAIKSILVLEASTDDHQEALLNLSRRLNTLLVHCREHFAVEERDLLPLLEAAERRSGGANSELQLVDRIIMGEFMEGTHSHLFHTLLSSLLPREAMQYLALVCRCRDQDRVAKMLVAVAAKMELAAAAVGAGAPSWPCSYRGSHPRQVANE